MYPQLKGKRIKSLEVFFVPPAFTLQAKRGQVGGFCEEFRESH